MLFFNTRSEARTIMQLCNIVAMGAATYELMTNPEASVAEMGFAMATYLASHAALRDRAGVFSDIGSVGINCMRLGAIYASTTSGVSSLPLWTNAVDGALRLTNIITQFSTSDDYEAGSTLEETRPKLA